MKMLRGLRKEDEIVNGQQMFTMKQEQAKKFPSFGGVSEGRGGHEKCNSSGKIVQRNSKNYFELPYNPNLKERAKELRKARNLSEVLFWEQVKNKQFKNFDFDRQKIIGNYIVDFYTPNCNVVIEIDGSSHENKQEYDAMRDEYLESLGLKVIHIEDIDVKKNISAVMTMLYNHPALTDTSSSAINFSHQSLTDALFDHPVLRTPLQRRGIGEDENNLQCENHLYLQHET
jgi:very-short-patch-repair endonuclease